MELGASCLFSFSFVLMGVVVGPYNIRQGETDPNLPLGGVLWQVKLKCDLGVQACARMFALFELQLCLRYFGGTTLEPAGDRRSQAQSRAWT